MLKDLDVTNAPMLTVWNKTDACADPQLVHTVASQRADTCAVSAATGEGIQTMMLALEGSLSSMLHSVQCLVPYAQVRLGLKCSIKIADRLKNIQGRSTGK